MLLDLRDYAITQWKFNEVSGNTVYDNINAYNGATVNDISSITSIDAPSNQDRSFYINGIAENVVELDDDISALSFTDGTDDTPFSVSLWVNMNTTSNVGYLISKADAGNAKWEWLVGIQDTYIFVSLFSQGSISSYIGRDTVGSTLSTIALGTWHHIAVTYNPSDNPATTDLEIYFDGVIVSGSSYSNGSYTGMSDTNAKVAMAGFFSSGSWINVITGKMDNVIIFRKVLTDGEVKFLYNNGAGRESLSSEEEIEGPTLVYPNGGESFTEGSINIQWTEPTIDSSEIIWYEIFITDDFDKYKKPETIQIATVPSGNTSYSYAIQKNLKGKESRIGIRSIRHDGQRSKMSFSADSFTIVNERLPIPSLMDPVPGGTYFSYIPFIFDHSSVLGRCSQRSFYQIYYKSDNQNIDWTLLQSNIMVGVGEFSIDASGFNTSSDYIFKVEIVDGDNVSQPVFINNVNVNNINFFVIDTVPPKGSIKVLDNEEYTKDKSLVLSLSSVDESTAVKDIQIQQTNVNSTDGPFMSEFVDKTSILTWDLVGVNGGDPVDGVKLIQARYRDYGDNVIVDSALKRYFRTYRNLQDREVTALYHDGIDIYYAFAEDSSTGYLASLYKNVSLLSTMDGDATALERYNSILYVAIKDSDNKGILQRYTDSLNTIADNNQQYLDSNQTALNSLYFADSVINSMEVFDNTLFLGLHNGSLLSFSGATVKTENDDYLNRKNIVRIKTDGNLLYIFFSNTTEVLVMSKNSQGNYDFNTIETES